MSMVTVDQALETILAKIKFKGVEKIPIGESLGRTLAEDIVARRDNPPLDNSAMDGYALIADSSYEYLKANDLLRTLKD